MHKLLRKDHDVMYRNLSPCAQPSGGEYHGRIKTLKAGD